VNIQPSRYWTEKEIEILRKLSAAGCTPKQAASVFKSRSFDAIKCMAKKLDLPLCGKPPEIDMEAFKQLMRKSSGSNRM
jgi:hypothetical protein